MTDEQGYLSYLTQQALINFATKWPKTEDDCLNIQLPHGVFWYRLNGEFVASDGKSFIKNMAHIELEREVAYGHLSPSEEFRQYLKRNGREVRF